MSISHRVYCISRYSKCHNCVVSLFSYHVHVLITHIRLTWVTRDSQTPVVKWGVKSLQYNCTKKVLCMPDSLRNCISPQYTCTILHRLLFCSKKVLIQTLHYPKCYAQKFEATMQLTCRKILSTMLCIQCGAVLVATLP